MRVSLPSLDTLVTLAILNASAFLIWPPLLLLSVPMSWAALVRAAPVFPVVEFRVSKRGTSVLRRL